VVRLNCCRDTTPTFKLNFACATIFCGCGQVWARCYVGVKLVTSTIVVVLDHIVITAMYDPGFHKLREGLAMDL
jgi:hypothetical protein